MFPTLVATYSNVPCITRKGCAYIYKKFVRIYIMEKNKKERLKCKVNFYLVSKQV